MWRFVLPLLSVIAAFNSALQINQFPIEMAVKIILTVQKRLFSRCIFFLHSTDPEQFNFVTLNQLQKTLTKHLFSAVSSRSISFGTYSTSFLDCGFNKPLYIITSSGSDMKQFLQQKSRNKLKTSKEGFRKLTELWWEFLYRKSVVQISDQMSTNKLLSEVKWLMFLDQIMNLDDFFSDVSVPIDCEFLVVQRLDSDEVVFSEVYNVSPHVYNVDKIGTWNVQGTTTWTTLSIVERRNNLRGMIFKAAVEPDNMSIIIKEFTSKNLPLKVTGYFGEVWSILEKQLNFRTEFVQSTDHAWGSLQPNNSWNGMMGMLVRGEADVAISAFTMTKGRLAAIDFMSPYWNDGLTLYIRQPNNFRKAWDLYTSPYSKELWIITMIDFALLGFGLSATYYLGALFVGVREDQRFKYIILQSLFIMLAIICQRSQVLSPSSISSHIVFLTAHITSMVLLASYSSVFISLLTMGYPELPFTTFQGLLDDGTYRLGVLQSSAELDYFEKANDSLMQLLNVRMILPEKRDLPESHLEGLRRLCTREKYAFVGPNSILQSLLSKIPCTTVSLPRAYIPATSAMIISKQSSYWRIFKHATGKLQRSGVLRRLLKIYTPFHPTLESYPSKMQTVNFEMILPLIVVLTTGILVAILLLFLEILKRKTFIRFPLKYIPMTSNFSLSRERESWSSQTFQSTV